MSAFSQKRTLHAVGCESRESINKCLRSWSDNEWIALRRNNITILHEEALQKMIEMEEGR